MTGMILEIGNTTEAAVEALERIFDIAKIELMAGDNHEWGLDINLKKLEKAQILLAETQHDLNSIASLIAIKINKIKKGG